MSQNQNNLSHLDQEGKARMVDVGHKPVTQRRAIATGSVYIGAELAEAIRENSVAKGDLLQVARLAGIQAAKKTSDLVMLCHPLSLSSINVDAEVEGERVLLSATVKTTGQTGVEMEAMTAVSVAALNVVDMGKAVNPHIVIESIQVTEKTGGKTGLVVHTETTADFKVALLTISDSRSSGATEDLATPMLIEAVNQFLNAQVFETIIMADDIDSISDQLRSWVEMDEAPELILTTGGTGIGPRDVTPEATEAVIERAHPGLLELVHARCLPAKPHAFLSRGRAGVAGNSLIVNLPGSPRGAVDTLRLMSDILPHAIATLKRKEKEHPQ